MYSAKAYLFKEGGFVRVWREYRGDGYWRGVLIDTGIDPLGQALQMYPNYEWLANDPYWF